jgi:hypothetical protein
MEVIRMKGKMCPFAVGASSWTKSNCFGETCSWYDQQEEKCCILTINENLKKIIDLKESKT